MKGYRTDHCWLELDDWLLGDIYKYILNICTHSLVVSEQTAHTWLITKLHKRMHRVSEQFLNGTSAHRRPFQCHRMHEMQTTGWAKFVFFVHINKGRECFHGHSHSLDGAAASSKINSCIEIDDTQIKGNAAFLSSRHAWLSTCHTALHAEWSAAAFNQVLW